MPEEIVTETTEPYYQPISADAIEKLINRRDPAEDLVNALKGIMRNKDGNIIHQGSPLMNQKGVNSMIQIFMSVMTPNIILTNLSESDILKITRLLGRSVLFDLRLHYKEYGLEDTAELDKVFTIMTATTISALKAANQGFTMEHIAPQIKRIETTQPIKRGLLPMIGGR